MARIAIYIDPTFTGRGNGTFGAPYSSWTQVTWTSDAAYLQKAGTVFAGSSAAAGASGAFGKHIVIGSYHPDTGDQITSGSFRAQISNSSVVNITGVGSGRSWIIYDSVEIFGSGKTSSTSENGIGLQTAGTGEIIIRNCVVRDVPGVGIYIQPGLNNYPTWIIENNEVYNTGSHGIQWTGSGSSWVIRNNNVHDTGYKAGSFGIVCSPHRYTGNASTWVNEAGNIYKCALATSQASENPLTFIESVYFSGGNAWNLIETTEAFATNLPVGCYAFIVSSATLYVNISSDPTTTTPSISYGRMRDWEITNNNVYDTNNFSTEGNGIHVDHNGAYGFIARNVVYGNLRHAIAYNKGHNVTAFANLCLVTNGNGLRGGNGRDNFYLRNTISSTANSTCIHIDASNAGGYQEAVNNICLGGVIGIEVVVPGGTNLAHHNSIFGQTSAYTSGSGLTASSNVFVNPELDNLYFPRTGVVRLGGLDIGGIDIYSVPFNNPSPIGAVQNPYADQLLAPQLITAETIGLKLSAKSTQKG